MRFHQLLVATFFIQIASKGKEFYRSAKHCKSSLDRVTSLEQLSLAEFSGELVRPKVYENNHKSVLGIWMDLEWKVKYSTVLFLFYVKNQPTLSEFCFH